MKLIRLLSVLILLGLTSLSYAQRNCGANDHLEQQLEKYPKLEQRMQAIEKATQQFINNPQKAVNGVITIPVVVHVVYNTSAENISDSQINSQIAVLNEDFRRLNSDANNDWPQAADSEIEFCLASVDPQGNSTTGITRTATSVSSFSTNDNVKFNSSGGKDAWPYQDYLNMWVCDLGGGLLGYAQFPGGPASTDGVVADYQYFGTTGTATAPFDLGRTTTHEVGHWLNLRHIWGDGPCAVDDLVSDTPSSDNPNYGCPLSHQSCGTTDMVANYMDYTDDGCMNLYTTGQKNRMRALFDTGGFRESLLSSNACGNGTPPTCTDGVQNGQETGVDCGGPDCPPCAPCSGTEVTLSITLDDYPEETTWELVDDNNILIASGGPYGSLPSGTTVSETFCLSDDCYDFTIFDSYGDGICCGYGNGSYSLVDENNNTLASGGNFGSSETSNFCFGSTPPSCTDGIQNGQETGVDCGGPDCVPCDNGGDCSYVLIDFNDFDSGWGIWNDGGSDCRRSNRDSNYAYSAPAPVRLRDNTNSSVMTTDILDLNGFEEVTIDFTYITASMENGEDFWLQASLDGGAWQTLVVWASGSDFINNSREFETVIITGTFSSNTRFRFRCDASNNSDYVYIDDVEITGCVNAANRLDINSAQEITAVNDGGAYNAEILSMKIVPNPAIDVATINVESSEEAMANISILNVNGQLIKKENRILNKGLNQIQTDVSTLEGGIYYVRIQGQHNYKVEKLLILK